MYDPDGYFLVPHVVTWLAGLGAEGKLPRRLGFVHPGDVADPLDLSPEENARRVIGGKLAAGAITAEVRLDPSGRWLPVPAHYWGSDAADVTMKSGEMDLHVVALAMGIDLEAGLFKAEVFLAVDKVVAALGFSLAPLEETPAPARSAPTATTPDKIHDAYQACVACLRAIIEANPSYRTHKRGELKALCRGGLKEQAWRDALAEAIDPHSAWKETGRRKQR